MTDNPFSISVQSLAGRLGSARWPQVIDVRLDADYAADPRDIPGSIYRREDTFDSWIADLDKTRDVVVSCQKGFKVSQGIVARLRAKGWRAASLEDGWLGWLAAGLPVLSRQHLIQAGLTENVLMVTRRHPKIDRIACPWLVQRFIAPAARFLYVDPDQVKAVADRLGGVPYDIKDCALSHVGEDCSFDTILKLAGLAGHAPLDRVARVVRGADNARPELAAEASGLLAISLGLSHLAGDDDHAMLQQAFTIYDGLYAWAAHAAAEPHNWSPKA